MISFCSVTVEFLLIYFHSFWNLGPFSSPLTLISKTSLHLVLPLFLPSSSAHGSYHHSEHSGIDTEYHSSQLPHSDSQLRCLHKRHHPSQPTGPQGPLSLNSPTTNNTPLLPAHSSLPAEPCPVPGNRLACSTNTNTSAMWAQGVLCNPVMKITHRANLTFTHSLFKAGCYKWGLNIQ